MEEYFKKISFGEMKFEDRDQGREESQENINRLLSFTAII